MSDRKNDGNEQNPIYIYLPDALGEFVSGIKTPIVTVTIKNPSSFKPSIEIDAFPDDEDRVAPKLDMKAPFLTFMTHPDVKNTVWDLLKNANGGLATLHILNFVETETAPTKIILPEKPTRGQNLRLNLLNGTPHAHP